jgi:hypothetical protein
VLDPRSRQLLRDALRPPPGFALDQAVLTTFSLDLVALLTVPLAFTFFPVKDADGPPVVDPLALLEALRRSAGRLSAFCQAGQIYVPAKAMLLMAHLEESVIPVKNSPGGVFHPKVTVLRYTAEDTSVEDANNKDVNVVYRVLISSRNLTFDRSWDTLLRIEGPYKADRSNGFTRNRPLSRFVGSLPGMAVGPVPAASAARCGQFATELLKTDFQNPDGFDEMEFLPLGLEGQSRKWPVLGHRRTLAMAPFVDSGFIRRFDETPLTLISRQAALDELLIEDVNALAGAWHLNAAADPVRDETATASDDEDTLELSPTAQSHGLHAKLFIGEEGWDAYVYTGSANATTAAFERNVEFLVRLKGKKKQFGIDALLSRAKDDPNDKDRKFADLLVPYVAVEQVVDPAEQSLDRLLDEARYTLAAVPVTARVEPAGELFRVTLTTDHAIKLSASVTVVCHPLTIKSNNAVSVPTPISAVVVVFESVTFEAITSFYGFRLTGRLDEIEKSCAFVVNATLLGAPEDRAGRLLTALLRNREQLLRYLLLLLTNDKAEAWLWAQALQAGERAAAATGGEFGMPLLEPLLRSLDQHPEQLDAFAKVVDDLCKTTAGRELIGPAFLKVWEPVWSARKELIHG